MAKKKYSKTTQEKMKGVEDFLIQRYGAIKPDFKIHLKLLADALEIYDTLSDIMFAQDPQDLVGRNGILGCWRDAQTQILKICAKLGVSPYDSGKLKSVESDSADLLSTLIGQDED